MLTVEMAVTTSVKRIVEDGLETGILCVVLSMPESNVLDSGMLCAELDLASVS